MKIEDQVVSLELAKEMKELGAEQDSVWYWTWAEWNGKTKWVLELQEVITTLKKEYFSAYTVAELGKMLPDSNHGEYVTIKDSAGMWIAWEIQKGLYDKRGHHIIGRTEADARAKMWIYLKKEGLI